MTVPPLISVVIATLNRAEYLDQALAGLTRLESQPFEVIVIEGPSKDNTTQVVERYAGRIKRTQCPKANLSMARNLGIGLAAGEIIAFLDDDAVPHPLWLERLVQPFVKPEIGGAGGYVIGRRGVEFQARKIICDRYGDTHFVAGWFDERSLDRKGGLLYPAPMGVNTAFRRSALVAIGGFDETFTYYLDETDLCLRLFDAGWQIDYVPEAFVWHQFASSHLRDNAAVPKEMRTIARSKAYFVHRHGPASQAGEKLAGFAAEKQAYLAGLLRDGLLVRGDFERLMREIGEGIAAGRENAASGQGRLAKPEAFAAPLPFLPFLDRSRHPLSVALVCRAYPPRGTGGIARWSQLAAEGLAARGATVHVLAEAQNGASIRFSNGIWLHEIEPVDQGHDVLMDAFEMTESTARWAMAVRQYAGVLASFDIDVLSFPIWDCEGIACFADQMFPIAVSLHTTSALAQAATLPPPRSVPRVGAAKAEASALEKAGLLLANSSAALRDIEVSSGVNISARAVIVPHGTPVSDSVVPFAYGSDLRILFIGRADSRKGYDIALEALDYAAKADLPVQATFVGDVFQHPLVDKLTSVSRLTVVGQRSRDELNTLFDTHHVVLVPSRYESFGLVAIEAMARGRPVIASDVGGLSEIVTDGANGFLIPPGPKMAAGIAEVLASLAQDPIRLESLSRAAHTAVRERFSLEIMCAGLEAAYISLRERAAC